MTWFFGGVPALYFVFARLIFHFPMSGLSSAHKPTERTTTARTRAVILAFICFLHCELGTPCMLGRPLLKSQIDWARALVRVKISRNKQGEDHDQPESLSQDRSRSSFSSNRC